MDLGGGCVGPVSRPPSFGFSVLCKLEVRTRTFYASHFEGNESLMIQASSGFQVLLFVEKSLQTEVAHLSTALTGFHKSVKGIESPSLPYIAPGGLEFLIS